MHDLSELTLRTSYHKGQDDIAQEFYLPCMHRAVEFDRAVGFFRSTVFIIAWPALRDFIQRGGKIRILCSQVLSGEDIDALKEGYAARVDSEIERRLLDEVRHLIADATLGDCAKVLAALIAQRALELQIAVLRADDARSASGRIFHDKLGIFRDRLGNVVMFKGSMNETWNGLAADGNLESVDVAASWMGARDLERAKNEEKYFSELWRNQYPTLLVRPFPNVAREELERVADPDWESSVQRLIDKASNEATGDVRGRTLRPHQSAGLASWNANGRLGILAFATGSGKTFTAITAIREALTERREIPLIVVPDQVLFNQWHEELLATTADLQVRILRAGAGHANWRDALRLWTSPGDQPRIVLSTVQTAASEDFRKLLAGGRHLLLIADEVHRLGSPHHQALLEDKLFGARLGLSATPERAGDAAGTEALIRFFGTVLEPRYTLADAVRDRVLTPYFYRPHTVELNEYEVADWQVASSEIRRLRGRLSGGDQTPGLEMRLQRLFIKRARIVKHAAAKIPLAASVMTEEYEQGQRWIVYCEDLSQLNAVSSALADNGVDNMPFHSEMEGNRSETLKWLDRRGGVVVAIKCLDEGVDIPSVTHALILASSKNPREFIQRRGRVLRKAPNKSLAFIHDSIVLPPRVPGLSASDDPIIAGELARAVEFAQYADNPAASTDLEQIAIESGMDWRTLAGGGFEDADD